MKIVWCSLDVNVITAEKVVTINFSLVTESICFINVKYNFHFYIIATKHESMQIFCR